MPPPSGTTRHGDGLGDYVRGLMARNAMIVLGPTLREPVDCVLCWTPGGKPTGGTGHALRLADEAGIPILNLAHAPVREALAQWAATPPFEQDVRDVEWMGMPQQAQVVSMRGGAVLPDNAVRIDRQTRWGNPFQVGDEADGRDEAIRRHKDWLWDSMLSGKIKRANLLVLHDRPLACWCAPKPCHGDTLAKAAAWAAQVEHAPERSLAPAQVEAEDSGPTP